MNILDKIDEFLNENKMFNKTFDLNDPKKLKVLDVFKVKTEHGKLKYLKKVTNGKYESFRYGDSKNVTKDDELVQVKLSIFEDKLIIAYGSEKEIVYPTNKVTIKQIKI